MDTKLNKDMLSFDKIHPDCLLTYNPWNRLAGCISSTGKMLIPFSQQLLSRRTVCPKYDQCESVPRSNSMPCAIEKNLKFSKRVFVCV